MKGGLLSGQQVPQKTRRLSNVLRVQLTTDTSLVRRRLFAIITALAGLILREICLFNSTKGVCLMVTQQEEVVVVRSAN